MRVIPAKPLVKKKIFKLKNFFLFFLEVVFRVPKKFLRGGSIKRGVFFFFGFFWCLLSLVV